MYGLWGGYETGAVTSQQIDSSHSVLIQRRGLSALVYLQRVKRLKAL